MTPAEVWAAATWKAGEALGEPYLGRMVVGAPADLLVFREDPTLARKAADSALWLAKALAHAPSEGLAHRTLANVFASLALPSEAFAQYMAALDIFATLQDKLQAAITRSSALPIVTDTLGTEAAFKWAESAREAFHEAGDELRLARLENTDGSSSSKATARSR